MSGQARKPVMAMTALIEEDVTQLKMHNSEWIVRAADRHSLNYSKIS